MNALLRWFLAVTMSIGLFMVAFPGCGRSSLEPEELDASASSSGSTSGGTVCGPSNCSNGCCDANGQCQTGRNARACGSIGSACKDCVTTGFDTCTNSRVCARTVTNCGPSNCSNGCCTTDASGNQQCVTGTDAAACGRGGATCTNCEDDGRACDLSTRSCGTTTCDASNCNGCCVGDLCLPGNSQFACGENGGQCGRCNSGQVCRIRSTGGRCEAPQVTCGPSNCAGCCTASGQCLTGSSSNACGVAGQRCDVCTSNERCESGFCQTNPTCGPDNCAGCCFGNTCMAPSETFCGAFGEQCFSCAADQQCNAAGFCENPNNCGPLSCAGCCLGDICAVGTQNTACGASGQQCQNCLNQFPSRTCQSGSCQTTPVCNASTCPFGCCQGNICVNGTQDTACGTGGGFDGGGGGQQCVNCTAFGQTCRNGSCQAQCGPGNCNGCCTVAGTCVTGGSSAACGQFGGTCDNCTARGSFCTGLVSPRSCNDRQTSCPASYPTECPAGVTTTPEPEAQNVCSDFDLDDIAFACTDGPDDFFCQLVVSEKSASCQSCIGRFNHPFVERTGLYACAASFVGADCRREMGCTTDCDTTSCEQCFSNSAEAGCYSLVNSGSGQCTKWSGPAATCSQSALGGGELCSQISYPDYSAWLREVGDYFCGDGQ